MSLNIFQMKKKKIEKIVIKIFWEQMKIADGNKFINQALAKLRELSRPE